MPTAAQPTDIAPSRCPTARRRRPRPAGTPGCRLGATHRPPARGTPRRLIACAVVTACALGSTGCIRAADDGTSVCTVIAHIRPEMRERHVTFSDIVARRDLDQFSEGIGSVLTFARSAGAADVEDAYQPALDYIVERTVAEAPALADDGGDVHQPRLTDRVIRSAQNLDADLEAGACD